MAITPEQRLAAQAFPDSMLAARIRLHDAGEALATAWLETEMGKLADRIVRFFIREKAA